MSNTTSFIPYAILTDTGLTNQTNYSDFRAVNISLYTKFLICHESQQIKTFIEYSMLDTKVLNNLGKLSKIIIKVHKNFPF